jgi:hypothetical protein
VSATISDMPSHRPSQIVTAATICIVVSPSVGSGESLSQTVNVLYDPRKRGWFHVEAPRRRAVAQPTRATSGHVHPPELLLRDAPRDRPDPPHPVLRTGDRQNSVVVYGPGDAGRG